MDSWNTIILIAALVGIINGIVSVLDKAYTYGKPLFKSFKKNLNVARATYKIISNLEVYLLKKLDFKHFSSFLSLNP
jgi:hypothetical protein